MERVGRFSLVLITLFTAAVVGLSAAMRIASDDLYAVANQARGTTGDQVRTAYGDVVAGLLTQDIQSGDIDAEYDRGKELGYRSERLRELAAVPAVIGLLIALLSDKPAQASREPAANTSSNGIA
jgi:hypothetical protein